MRNTDERIDGLYALLAVLVLLAALTGYCGYRNWQEAVERGDNTIPTVIDDQAGRGRALPGDRAHVPCGAATKFPPRLVEPKSLLNTTERAVFRHLA